MDEIRAQVQADQEEDEIYRKLRERLDAICFGYSATESGVEYVFLKRFFSPEDAEMFLLLPIDRYVSAEEVAAECGGDPKEVGRKLKDMAKRGIIFRIYDEEGRPLFHSVPIAHGIYEFHINEIEDEWSRAFTKHYLQGWGPQFYEAETPLFRSLPMSADVVADGAILPEDDFESMIRTRRRWGVTDCMCRSRLAKMGKGCKHELETCLVFDTFADYYLENGIAREIDADEAIDIVRRNTKQGCVVQVVNDIDLEAMCCCCSCSCGLIGAMKYFPGPGMKNVSNYVAVRDAEACIEGKCPHNCAKVCPMGAFRDKDGELTFNPKKCIGCGICAAKCPGHAIELHVKPEEEQHHPPKDIFDTYAIMAEERGFDVHQAMVGQGA